jgi:hypothetical protein
MEAYSVFSLKELQKTKANNSIPNKKILLQKTPHHQKNSESREDFELIHTLITFISSEQKADGSFPSLTSTSTDFTKDTKEHSTSFVTSLVLDCLNTFCSLTSPKCRKQTVKQAEKIRKKCLSFLLREESSIGSWNYWKRDSDDAKSLPYPDDLDDTFLALSAIYNYCPEKINGKRMLEIAHLLIISEEKEGGPYRTWLVDNFPDTHCQNAWLDIDLAVNANIAYFLSLQDIFLPNIEKLLEKAIRSEKYSSPYYSSLPIIYFISRYYRQCSETIEENAFRQLPIDQPIDQLLRKHLNTLLKEKPQRNTLEFSLALSTLINLDSSFTLIEECRKKLDQNLSWLKPLAFNENILVNGQRQYHGACVLTSAFLLEALFLYQKRLQEEAKKIEKEGVEIIKKTLLSQIRNDTDKISPFLKNEIRDALEILLKKDVDHQMTLLPYFLQKSFRIKVEKSEDMMTGMTVDITTDEEKVGEQKIIELGKASLYGWIAYRIYDKILDCEEENRYLMAASWYVREMTSIYRKILVDEKAFTFWKYKMEIMESAVCWEKITCYDQPLIPALIPDFADYSQLAEKSLGHALAPATILYLNGYDFDSKENHELFTFFNHYLIARQLHNDGHDWEEDLRRGMLNSVCIMILKEYPLQSKKPTSNLLLDIEELRKIFWDKSIATLARQILHHSALALESLKKISQIIDTEYLQSLIRPLEKSAEKILSEKKKVEEFLAEKTKQAK